MIADGGGTLPDDDVGGTGTCFAFGVWNSCKHNLQLQDPSGGAVSAGDKQYM